MMVAIGPPGHQPPNSSTQESTAAQATNWQALPVSNTTRQHYQQGFNRAALAEAVRSRTRAFP
jgi:hypothetical protein